MAREPLVFYRLWCGTKRWSGWKPNRREAMLAGVPHGVTYQDSRAVSLGPLAWVEKGERRYARSRTLSHGPI